jgi:hypothetical protein
MAFKMKSGNKPMFKSMGSSTSPLTLPGNKEINYLDDKQNPPKTKTTGTKKYSDLDPGKVSAAKEWNMKTYGTHNPTADAKKAGMTKAELAAKHKAGASKSKVKSDVKKGTVKDNPAPGGTTYDAKDDTSNAPTTSYTVNKDHKTKAPKTKAPDVSKTSRKDSKVKMETMTPDEKKNYRSEKRAKRDIRKSNKKAVRSEKKSSKKNAKDAANNKAMLAASDAKKAKAAKNAKLDKVVADLGKKTKGL